MLAQILCGLGMQQQAQPSGRLTRVPCDQNCISGFRCGTANYLALFHFSDQHDVNKHGMLRLRHIATDNRGAEWIELCDESTIHGFHIYDECLRFQSQGHKGIQGSPTHGANVTDVQGHCASP